MNLVQKICLVLLAVVLIVAVVDTTYVEKTKEETDENFNDLELFYLPHSPTQDEFNESGLDIWVRVAFNKSTNPFTDVTISISLPKEYKECFIEYVKDNYYSWFDNITLDCNKDYLEITNFEIKVGDEI